MKAVLDAHLCFSRPKMHPNLPSRDCLGCTSKIIGEKKHPNNQKFKDLDALEKKIEKTASKKA
jgi:hypothetical protein